ncbi:hypothetical protein HNQ91_000311 [Filimonas zeae]|nr:hypothetical protein [Filimonas zeae]MDR6337289.1 hypothetical protein [Filimonas zeae]
MKKTMVGMVAMVIAFTSCQKDKDVQGISNSYTSSSTAVYSAPVMYTSAGTVTQTDSIAAVVKAYDPDLFVYKASGGAVDPAVQISFETDNRGAITLFNKPHSAVITRTAHGRVTFTYMDTIKIPVSSGTTPQPLVFISAESFFDSLWMNYTSMPGTIGLKDTACAFDVHFKEEGGKLYLPFVNAFNLAVKKDATGTVISSDAAFLKRYIATFDNTAIKPLQPGHTVIIQTGTVQMMPR